MKLYLSGQMTGLPDHGYGLFREYAEKLRAKGFEVIDPSENFGGATDRQRSEYMRLDVQHLLTADAVAVLPNWYESAGSRLEVSIARELGLPVYYVYCVLDGTFRNCEPCVRLVKYHLKDAARHDAVQQDETQVVDPRTGGKKGQKLARFDLIPWRSLTKVAELYGIGAKKYEERNWEKGYAWSLSHAALARHFALWMQGEANDPDGFHHLAAVVFHALALMQFEETHPELDDRSKTEYGVRRREVDALMEKWLDSRRDVDGSKAVIPTRTPRMYQVVDPRTGGTRTTPLVYEPEKEVC